MPSTLRRRVRSIAVTLVFLLMWDGFAHAARPSSRLAALQAAVHPQRATGAPALHALLLGGEGPARADGPTPTPPLPLRDRMVAAHTVFLAQTGVDSNFAISATDAYNTVLNAVNQWGRYRVVSDASQADVVFQLHGEAVAYSDPGDSNSAPTVSYLSTLRLTVADPHTLSPLWVLNVPVQPAVRHKTRLNNTALAGENVVSQLKQLVGDPLTAQDQAGLKTIRASHKNLIVFGAVGAALTLGLLFLGLHLMHSRASSFCQQHNLSPCPGA